MSFDYQVVVLSSGIEPFTEWRIGCVSLDALHNITQGSGSVVNVKAAYQTFKFAKVLTPGDELGVAREKKAIIEEYRQVTGDPEDSEVLIVTHHQDFGIMQEQAQ